MAHSAPAQVPWGSRQGSEVWPAGICCGTEGNGVGESSRLK